MITNIDAKKILEIFKGGELNLELNKAYIDSLNVFPVPDGDTGTNMTLTMNSTLKEMSLSDPENMVSVCKGMSVGALKGARGNSGVILSQIFKGMANVLSEVDLINTKTFSRALAQGSQVAYEVVAQPKEGTILTIIRMVSAYALKISTRTSDYETFFTQILKQGKKVLADTPNMLPVLKKAGVVDAGGAGLLIILEGMYNILVGIEMKALQKPEVLNIDVSDNPDEIQDFENINFSYCTEFFIINLLPKTTISDIDKLRDSLNEIGDCVLVIGDLNLVKVHVHTNNPDKAIGFGLKLGELNKLKIDNMVQQFRELHKPNEKMSVRKPVGMMAICNGEGLKNIFTELRADIVIEGGQTMNPSVEDISAAVNKVNADTVYVLPNNSNIILAAEQAKGLTDSNIVVIPSKDIPQGIAAAINYNPEAGEEENVEMMRRAISSIRSGMVTHAVRDTEMEGYELHDGDIIGIYGNIAAKGDNIKQVTKDLISKMIDEDSSTVTLYRGAEVSEEESEILKNELLKEHLFFDILVYSGGQQHYYYYVAVE
jgi:DAK2 domain fusion protein YloV